MGGVGSWGDRAGAAPSPGPLGQCGVSRDSSWAPPAPGGGFTATKEGGCGRRGPGAAAPRLAGRRRREAAQHPAPGLRVCSVLWAGRAPPLPPRPSPPLPSPRLLPVPPLAASPPPRPGASAAPAPHGPAAERDDTHRTGGRRLRRRAGTGGRARGQAGLGAARAAGRACEPIGLPAAAPSLAPRAPRRAPRVQSPRPRALRPLRPRSPRGAGRPAAAAAAAA